MADEKVVSLDGKAIQYGQEVYQLDLFGETQVGANYFCFLNVDDFDQDEFIDILVRNSVGMVVDIRPEPYFASPNYDHKQVTGYLYERSISYLEYAIVRVDPGSFSPWRIARSVNKGRPKGLTIWLYDQAAKECGWFDLVKSQLNKSRLFRAELSPRVLKH